MPRPFPTVGALVVSTSSNQGFGGVISGSGSLTQSGPGMLTLSNSGNSYSGPTIVLGGTLFMSGSSSLPNSTLTVAGGATFSTADGTARTTAVAGLNLGSAATLVMDWGDTLSTAGTAAASGNINLALSGSYSLGTAYAVLQAGGGLAAASYNVPIVTNNTNYTLALSVASTAVTVTPTAATPLATAYWYGGQVTAAPAAMAISNGA